VTLRYHILHSLNYSYSKPVFFEPLLVRLRPRCDSIQQVIDFNLNVIPIPEGITEYIDQECNNAATLWFSGSHRTLSISAQSQVEVIPPNPFNFVITKTSMLTLPAHYPKSYRRSLQTYMKRRGRSLHVDDFVQPVVDETAGETTAFLTKFVLFIYEQFDKIERETGAPLTPDETITRRRGACRDLALLFMEGCRAVGLAARFVSGYMWSKELPEKHDLHAWVEVYIPGGGWRGFDPSTGLAVTERHIVIATAANPIDAAPVSGTFRGHRAYSKFEYDVSIDLSRDS